MTINQPLAGQQQFLADPSPDPAHGDPFASLQGMVPAKRDAARSAARTARAEIEALFRDKRWEDVLTLFHPLEEKMPELLVDDIDIDVRGKIAFALGQAHRFDEAIDQLGQCIHRRPDDFYLHNAMAYTAYNTLYASMNKEIFLRGKHRLERIELAHRHFEMAQMLRPEGVTNYYRQGMLYKQIEGKAAKALPLFFKAIANWERLDAEAQADRQQERKNYVKALYNGASAALACHRARQALDMIQRCLAADTQRDTIAPSLRFFALGKVLFHLNRFDEARKALETALETAGGQPVDFAIELLARTWLCLNNGNKALQLIRQIPEKRRRPYICWTEADALCMSGDLTAAARRLEQSAERDNRSRHKSRVRLARIAYLTGDYEKTRDQASKALAFFQENWGKDFDDGLFWLALAELKCGNPDIARQHALALKANQPDYPKLSQLLEAIG